MTRIPLLCLTLVIAFRLHAQELFPVRDEGETRSRTYHVLHYKIEVSFDEPQRTVHGRVTTTLVPFLPDLQRVDFDAEQMEIHRVTMANGKALPFTVGPKSLSIQLEHPSSYRDTLTIVTEYSCTPKRGLYFVQPDSAYPSTPWQIWTQGEDMDNHFWFPCYDFPNDRATTEVIATVRASYTVLSNGKLVNVSEDKKNKTKTFHWKISKPHASYLVMLAIGEYAVLKDSAGTVPLEYYVYPQQVADARICFQSTPDILRFYTERIGVPYPWEKYAQVLLHDFIEGGMENTSACSLMDNATVYDARQRIDDSPTSLIAHELAHQWWGDLVTCKDWRHLWLNEGFASYFDPLYHEKSLGRDEFDYIMHRAQQSGINSDRSSGRKPIVSVGSYSANLYPRAASVLHMLRYLLGDSLFFRSLNHYITNHQLGVVETNDLKVAIEETTGRNLYWFFDQWLYKAGYPVFTVSSDWEDSTKCLKVHVVQTQKTDSLTGIFRTPADIEVTAGTEAVVHRVEITSRDTVFSFPAIEKPRLVLFDKGNWILKELKFEKSDDELTYQMAHASNTISRLLAVKQAAAAPKNKGFIPALIDRALHDSFWAVRREAVSALGVSADREDSAWQQVKVALLAAARDASPKVRPTALFFLTDSTDAQIVDALHAALKDSSYAVVSQALRSLAKADPHRSIGIFGAHLGMPSHQDILATTALGALSRADSTLGITVAKECLAYGTPAPLRNTALWILQRFIRTGTLPESTFYPLVTDKSVQFRANAIRMLGDVGTTASVQVLETVALDPKNEAADAAKRSIERIRRRMEAQEKQ
jgi:aminopeptidase N